MVCIKRWTYLLPLELLCGLLLWNLYKFAIRRTLTRYGTGFSHGFFWAWLATMFACISICWILSITVQRLENKTDKTTHSLLISIENPPHLWVKQKLGHDPPIKLMTFQTNHQETMTTDCGMKEIGASNEKNRIKLKGHVKNSNNLSYVQLPSTVTCMAVSINNIPYSSD